MRTRYRTSVIKVHRWLSLGVAALWLLQALSGMLIVFHWEIDDLTVAGTHHSTDLAAIDRRARTLTPPGSGLYVESIWNSAGRADRYDIFIEADPPATGATIRIDGAGNVLRTRRADETWTNGGWIDQLVLFHHEFMAGDFGSWIVGVSGCLLLSNIMLGLIVAWPRPRTWRRALRPPSSSQPAARRYGWHRAVGLWAAIPALLSIGAGTMLVFASGVERIIAPPAWSIEPRPSNGDPFVAMPQAVDAALARYPQARISGITYPVEDNAVYRMRLRQPGEDARAYGQTTVFVDAATGEVVGDFDALSAAPSRRLVNGLFAFHTGEFGGPIGRVAVLMLGLWLVTMIMFGVLLWSVRRRQGR